MSSDDRCFRHQFEESEAMCRHCGERFCSECLVYSFGPKKPPFCIACALAASGVRAHASQRPRLSRRDQRRVEKEAKQAARAATAPAVADASSMAIDWPSGDGRMAS